MKISSKNIFIAMIGLVHYINLWHYSLRWHHNGHDGVSNHQPHDCLLNSLFGHRSKKTSKFRVTGLCVGNSPVTGEFPAQMASNAENVSIWWRHYCGSYYAPGSQKFIISELVIATCKIRKVSQLKAMKSKEGIISLSVAPEIQIQRKFLFAGY